RADECAAKTSAGVLMSVAERVLVQENMNSHQHIAVPLHTPDRPAVVRQKQKNAVDVGNGRPLVFEDLRRFPSATFHTYRREAGQTTTTRFQGNIGDSDDYRAAIRRAHGV